MVYSCSCWGIFNLAGCILTSSVYLSVHTHDPAQWAVFRFSWMLIWMYFTEYYEATSIFI
jgi:hypothetical protein